VSDLNEKKKFWQTNREKLGKQAYTYHPRSFKVKIWVLFSFGFKKRGLQPPLFSWKDLGSILKNIFSNFPPPKKRKKKIISSYVHFSHTTWMGKIHNFLVVSKGKNFAFSDWLLRPLCMTNPCFPSQMFQWKTTCTRVLHALTLPLDKLLRIIKVIYTCIKSFEKYAF